MQSWQKVTDKRESELHSIVRKYILQAFVALAANMLSVQRNSYGAVRSNSYSYVIFTQHRKSNVPFFPILFMHIYIHIDLITEVIFAYFYTSLRILSACL